MKKIILGVVVISLLLLTACASKISDSDLKKGLSELSDNDLDSLIEETDRKDTGAVAGQAILSRKGYTWAGRVSRKKLIIAAQQLKIERLESQIAKEGRIPSGTGTIPPPDDDMPGGIEIPGETGGHNPHDDSSKPEQVNG